VFGLKNNKLQIGIIGCGGIANQKHLPSLSKLPELCELVAFCDIKEERAIAAAGKYGAADAKTYVDYKELLKDESIDVVHVLTPNVAHSPITVDAFEAGKHVMCEKPMAHNSAEARKMIDAADRAGKKFTIGYQNRFRPEIQTLYKACQAGYLGDIYFSKAHAVRRRAVPTWGVFQDKAQQGGGPLIDIGTHALDITLWMMDNYEPKSVDGSVFYKMADQVEGNMTGPWNPATFEVEDSAFGFIKMKNDATIFLEASWVLNVKDAREAATTLCGTKAGAEIVNSSTPGQGDVIFNGAKFGRLFDEKAIGGGAIAYFDPGAGDPGYAEAKQWLESIIQDTEPLVKPQQAFVVTQILEAIYNSSDSGDKIIF